MLTFVSFVNKESLELASDQSVDYKYWAAKSNQSPCKLLDLVVADKTEFVETADMIAVDIAGVIAAEIDIAAVDTSCGHYYSLVVGCIDKDAFYHSVIGQIRSE